MRKMFTVWGPCRDYDFAPFCEDHHAEATAFATEWIEDIVDTIDLDDERVVKVAFRQEDEDLPCMVPGCSAGAGPG